MKHVEKGGLKADIKSLRQPGECMVPREHEGTERETEGVGCNMS